MVKDSPKFKLEELTYSDILFKNFAGKESKFTTEGDRHFSVILPDELATQLLADGWNVKYLKPRDEGDPEVPCVQVSVSYKNRPPRIVMITGSGGSEVRTPLNEDNVETLDFADIRTCDLIVNGYEWDVNGKTGTKGYLQTMYITIEEDELQRKYAEAPEDSENAYAEDRLDEDDFND